MGIDLCIFFDFFGFNRGVSLGIDDVGMGDGVGTVFCEKNGVGEGF